MTQIFKSPSYFSAWSEDGCYIEQTNRTHTVCMCNHLTNFAILMDLVDDGAETLQQLSFFNENMKLMISISVAVCIVFIIIALITLKLFNGIFVKVRDRRRQGVQSSTNGREDIIIHTNPNNTGANVSPPIHYTQNTLMSSDCGSASATSQNSSTPLNVLRNINYVAQSTGNRSQGGSIRGNSIINNNIFSERSHDQNNRNNLQNINNNRNVINSNSNLVNNIAFMRETEIGPGMNGIHDGVIVMRNNVINGLVGINPGIQYHLHHHLHHHHHHSTSEVSSLSSQSSPSLDIRPSHHQVQNNLCENINLRDFSV